MKPYLIAAILGITAIVITSLSLGYDSAAVAGGISTIAALAGWQGKAYRDRTRGSSEVMAATMRKAGYSDRSITRAVKRLKTKGG